MFSANASSLTCKLIEIRWIICSMDRHPDIMVICEMKPRNSYLFILWLSYSLLATILSILTDNNNGKNIVIYSVMSHYEGARTRFRVEFEVNVGMHQRFVMSHFLLAVVVDIVTSMAREGVLSELLYADDLILMNEVIEGIRSKFLEWKVAFESKGLIVKLGKTKVMVSSGFAKGWHVYN